MNLEYILYKEIIDPIFFSPDPFAFIFQGFFLAGLAAIIIIIKEEIITFLKNRNNYEKQEIWEKKK